MQGAIWYVLSSTVFILGVGFDMYCASVTSNHSKCQAYNFGTPSQPKAIYMNNSMYKRTIEGSCGMTSEHEP